LGDAVGGTEDTSRRDRIEGARAQEQTVVFEADRPVRRETDFDACADRATPAGVVDGVDQHSGRSEGPKAIADDGRAALHITEPVVPGPADLAGQQAERIDPGLIGETSNCERGASQQVDVAALEVGPVALAFEAEPPVLHLPAIADLAA